MLCLFLTLRSKFKGFNCLYRLIKRRSSGDISSGLRLRQHVMLKKSKNVSAILFMVYILFYKLYSTCFQLDILKNKFSILFKHRIIHLINVTINSELPISSLYETVMKPTFVTSHFQSIRRYFSSIS